MRAKRAKTALCAGGRDRCACFVFAAPALAAAVAKPKQATATATRGARDAHDPDAERRHQGEEARLVREGRERPGAPPGRHAQDRRHGRARGDLLHRRLATRGSARTPSSRSPSSASKQGVRQTQGTLTVGSTWNRAAKVAETGSFEVKAGGATAAVEGTLFSVVCTCNGAQTSCEFIDLFDPVIVTLGTARRSNSSRHEVVTLDQGQLGGVAEPHAARTCSATSGSRATSSSTTCSSSASRTDLPPPRRPPPTRTATAPPRSRRHRRRRHRAGRPADDDRRSRRSTRPSGEHRRRPPERRGRAATRRSAAPGASPSETLSVLFDGVQVGTLPTDSAGNFAGSITIPQGTTPGPAPADRAGIRVRAQRGRSTCSGAAAALAFTGASSHTLTYVLARRRRGHARAACSCSGSRRRRSSGALPSA